VVLRWPLPLAIAGLLATPASAADQSVTARPGNTFSPSEVTVDLGDTVTWNNGGGFHNVKFDDGSFEQPAEPDISQWSVERTFDKPGHYLYYCEQHGGPNGSGMSGHVAVRDATGTVPGPNPAPDPVTPPGLGVTAPREQALERLVERGLRPQVRCDGGCDATLRLSINGRTAKRFGLGERRTRIGRRKVSLPPSGRAKVRVRLKRKAKQELADASRGFKVRLDVRATRDTTETARRTVAIKP
jgi:plastocyanin